jgi:hypothetical protein
MTPRPSLRKDADLDFAPGYAALSELPRRRRRGAGVFWLAAGAAVIIGLSAWFIR